VAEDVSAGAGVGASKSLRVLALILFKNDLKTLVYQGGTPEEGSRERYKDAAWRAVSKYRGSCVRLYTVKFVSLLVVSWNQSVILLA